MSLLNCQKSTVAIVYFYLNCLDKNLYFKSIKKTFSNKNTRVENPEKGYGMFFQKLWVSKKCQRGYTLFGFYCIFGKVSLGGPDPRPLPSLYE